MTSEDRPARSHAPPVRLLRFANIGTSGVLSPRAGGAFYRAMVRNGVILAAMGTALAAILARANPIGVHYLIYFLILSVLISTARIFTALLLERGRQRG